MSESVQQKGSSIYCKIILL